MPFEQSIHFLKDYGTQHLKDFIKDARRTEGGMPWRCLYSLVDPVVTKELSRKHIAASSLKSALDDNADDIQVFWLSSGHLFIFFQGPVRAVIKNYESFLDFISNGRRPDYHFFWEIPELEGYFDQLLNDAIGSEDSPPASETRKTEQNDFSITPELARQRQIRFRPLLLIVEDDRVTRHILQASMEKYCDIAIAWTAEQAVRLYKTMLPNNAFLEIELPDGDGQELAELFCALDSESFIVMISGMLNHEKTHRCLRAGVRECVAKPAQEQELLELIDRYRRTRVRNSATGS
ncbi:MAG: response regulator [Alphaproteobacteria bacterium]